MCIAIGDQEGSVGIPLPDLSPLQFCACPMPGPGFPKSHVVVFLCSVSSIKVWGHW
jgi:hypothetical protein